MRKTVRKYLVIVLCCLFPLTAAAAAEETAAGINLTDREVLWLNQHRVIRVANELDWPPFDYNESGEPRGMAIDYIRLLTGKLGIEPEFVSGHSWAELVRLFKARKIDVMPVFYITEERRDFTLYTDAYHEGKLGVFRHVEDLNKYSDLSNRRVGMESSHGSIPIVKKQIPGIRIIEIDYKKDLVRKLATRELDAIIGNPFLFYYHARNSQIDTIRLTDYIRLSEAEQKKTSLHIGVRKDWPVLHSILRKTMDSVSHSEMEAIRKKWTDISIVEPVNWTLIIQISGVVIFIVLFLIWNNRRLNALVAAKTKALSQMNDSLELMVEERTNKLNVANLKLQQSLEEIKTLQGIIPICASCKKIRDDQGYWNILETFIQQHSDASFNYSICPECSDRLYGKEEWYQKRKDKGGK